jgi:hypothetical protein
MNKLSKIKIIEYYFSLFICAYFINKICNLTITFLDFSNKLDLNNPFGILLYQS